LLRKGDAMIKINLAVLMAEREIKISDLAKQTGISRTTLTSLYYNQAKGVQFDTLDVICDHLMVKPNELILHENFSYEFELPKEIKLEDGRHNEFEIDLGILCKLSYENRLIQETISLSGWLVFCKNTTEETGREVIEQFLLVGDYGDKISSAINNVPLLVRKEFEKGLIEDLKAFYSNEYDLAPKLDFRVSINSSRVKLH